VTAAPSGTTPFDSPTSGRYLASNRAPAGAGSFLWGGTMRRTALLVLGLVVLAIALPRASLAQTAGPERNRPLRVGNTNLVLFGLGWTSFDHPTFDDDLVPGVMYARRVLRRESRVFPVWLRGGLGFLSEDRTLHDTYTIWAETDEAPFPDSEVREHMSDFQVRAEILADLFHRSHGALYVGAGFAVHALSFSSDGSESRIPPFETSQNELAPSFAAGGRLHSAKKPYTIYGEARWGKAYGRNEAPTTGPKRWLTDQTFEFTNVSAWVFEGGVGVHW
jgi:hypothetical protein